MGRVTGASNARTAAIIPSLDEAAARYRAAAETLMAVYTKRRPATTAQVTPDTLHQAVEQFFSIGRQLERDPASQGPSYKDNASQLGDYAITLLADLAAWAGQLGLAEAQQEIEAATLAVADWVVRQQGELRSLEPIVNAAAAYANRTQEPHALEALCGFISRVLAATANAVQQHQDKGNPGRPWRVLHLNRAIVATRTHNAALMEQVFAELVQALPEDAPHFFAEGMKQMDALDYPPPVRAVMSRYFDEWTRRTMN